MKIIKKKTRTTTRLTKAVMPASVTKGQVLTKC